MLKLYYAKGTCALASHLALAEAKATFEPVIIDFSVDEQRSDDYLKLNPKGRVPALVTEQGILTETPAILVYIAQLFPNAKLAPLDDPFALAQVQAFNSYLCSTVHVAHAHGGRGKRWVDDPAAIKLLTAKVPETMAACFDMIENEMIRGPWVMGDHYTVCDPYLFTLTRWLERDGVSVSNYPKVSAHYEAMSERPATRAVLPLHKR